MSNFPAKGTALMAYTRFSLDRSTPSLWRVTFDNPPINLIDPVMAVELDALLTEIEQDDRLAVVVFDSADRAPSPISTSRPTALRTTRCRRRAPRSTTGRTC